jgi:hypothetical protein
MSHLWTSNHLISILPRPNLHQKYKMFPYFEILQTTVCGLF